MNYIKEIESLKTEFEMKYENNPMTNVLVDGCYETKMMVAKTEQTVLADTNWRKLYAIYEEYQELLKKHSYEVVWHQNLEKYVLQYQNGKMVDAYNYRYSQKTKIFLDKYQNPCEALVNVFMLLDSANGRYAGQYKGLAKGDHGEEYVDQTLELFQGKYKYAKNIKISHEDYKGKTSETDLYVMTEKGILVCEIKNKGNENFQFKISKDGQWSKYDRNGKFIEVMESPFAQNTRHCIATEKLLKENGVTDFKIIPVVIIANEKVRIDNDSDNSVIRISELYNFVEKLNYPEKYNEEYQQKIVDLLYENHIEEENFFELNIVEEHMHKLTIDYAEYYLQMIHDMQSLCATIHIKEKGIVEQKIKEMKKENEKKVSKLVIGIGLIDIVAIIMYIREIYTLLSVGLGIVGFVGTIFAFFYIKEDIDLENRRGKDYIEYSIMSSGEY